MVEEYLNFIVSSSKPKALSVEQITEASNKDPIIQEVVSRMLKGEWKSTPKDIRVQPFFCIRNNLTIAPAEHGIILLFENRVVIPLALQADQGLVKTKQLLHDKVWFPGINQVEDVVKQCIPCLASTPTNHQEPLQMIKISQTPWYRMWPISDRRIRTGHD